MIYVFHKRIRTIMSKLQDFNTGESNENESVHKFNESVVSKIAILRLNLYLFE
jgi:hypothetical protein